MNEPKSNCCQANLTIFTGSEGTNHWICAKCGQPADPMQNEPQLSAIEEMALKYNIPLADLESLLATALEEQKKAINDEWLYQKANDHDARIRADERSKVLAEVESWLVEVDETNDYERGMNWTVRELRVKLIERKNESN